MHRYLKLNTKSLFNYTVVYFDDYINKEYTADSVFIQNDLKVKFAKDFINKDEGGLRLHMVKIKKRDLPKFELCMKKLANKMVLLGYTNYEKDVDVLIKSIINDIKGMEG